MATLHDGAIYGLHQFTFKGTVWGYISDDSIEWGGDNISTEDIWAAQKRRAPFKRLVSSPGSDVLSGDLIQLIPKNLQAALGGTLNETEVKWSAPTETIIEEGPLEITTADGVVISIPKASLVAKPQGSFGYSDVFKIHFEFTIMTPDDEKEAPYTITYPTGEVMEG